MQICVATDLSDSGIEATTRAIAWAKAHDAEVHLLHVVLDPELAPAFSDDVAGDVERARTALNAIAEQAHGPCRVDVRTAEDVAAEILKAAADAAYLFVGSQGKSAFERMRLGSVATQVVRQSTVPIVACPHPREA